MKRFFLLSILTLFLFVLNCCGSSNQSSKKSNNSFILKSSALQEGKEIPKLYTCKGKSINPPLKWENAPKETKSFVLIFKDPDAPSGLWTHWVVYNIPNTTISVDENSKIKGAKEGLNEMNKRGYYPPCPPSGTHRYIFDLYALDVAKITPKDEHRRGVEEAMRGHIIAETKLIAKFSH